MAFLWKQPKLCWGVAVSADQIQVVAVRDRQPQPQLCHQFSIAAPNVLQLPSHLNNPMAVGKSLAQVLRELGVQSGRCVMAVPDVTWQRLELQVGAAAGSLWQTVQTHLQQVAEPAQSWAFDVASTDHECTVAYAPQSLINDYLVLASYLPLATCALEPEGSAVERVIRVYWPDVVMAASVVLVLMPRGTLWQVYQAGRLVDQSFTPWHTTPETLLYGAEPDLPTELVGATTAVRETLADPSELRLLVAGRWALTPAVQTTLTASWGMPPKVLDVQAMVGPALYGSSEISAQSLIALGLALRACRHVAV